MGKTLPQSKSIKTFLIALIGMLVVTILILSSVPPVSRDALTHHLAVPKLWLRHGGMYQIPQLVFSYYPMNLDLLYMIPLCFGNDILPKYIHFAFALATSWLIFRYLRHRLDTFWGLFGALLFLSTPAIVKLSITAYVDLGLVFFATASLLCALRWYQHFPAKRHLVTAAIFCGLAIGTKYNGLVVWLLVTLLIGWIASQRLLCENRHNLRIAFFIFLFVFIAGIVYAPWGIRNWFWTNNPVFPLFDGFFNSANPREFHSLPPFALRKLIYHEKWWEIALIPLRIFVEGRDNIPRFFDGKLNTWFLVLPVFAFAGRMREEKTEEKKFEKRVLLIFSILLILIVFFQSDMRIRYVAPAIPCIVILSVIGLKNIVAGVETQFSESRKVIATGASLMLITFCLAPNVLYIKKQFDIVMPLQYLSGKISRDQYIEKFRPEYGVIRYANGNLPRNSKILALFIGKRGYYSELEMSFDPRVLKSAIQNSRSAEDISARLIHIGFSHILIRFDLFRDWCQQNLNNKERQMIFNLFSHRGFSFKQDGHGLYQL